MQNRPESITVIGRIIKHFHHQEVITFLVAHISRKDNLICKVGIKLKIQFVGIVRTQFRISRRAEVALGV